MSKQVEKIPQKQGNEDYEVGYCKPPKEMQFKPGQSGNPGGLPKGTSKVSIALMKLLKTESGEEFKPKTRAEAVALALLTKALTGDVQAIKEISDRTEGKAPATINVNRDEAKGERYRKLVDELCENYGKSREEVIQDIIERDSEAALYLM